MTTEQSLPPAPLELRHVTISFGSQTILRDLTLAVRAGETLVVIGESGCGKSVLLKLMTGLLSPTQGTIHWSGRNIKNLKLKELTRERLKIGYLFQGAALFDSMTVFENVAFGLRQNTSLSENDIRQIVGERLADVGLAPSVCSKKPGELSGGMKKRVGLARALALMPDIMFYDEPTTGLDPVMSDVINELILQTRVRRPVTSIVVTHDMTTVRKVADRVVMLYPLSRLDPHDSQIVFQGTAEDAFASSDLRVSQFVRGEAGDRLREMSAA